MEVRFWGVRGSIPVSGPDIRRTGGDTSCIELRASAGPPLVVDAGTGARRLGDDILRRRCGEVALLFTHFHMDHLFGFPFFKPLFSPSVRVRVWAPGYSELDARNRVAHFLNGIYHPLHIEDVAAKVGFFAVRPGRPFEVGPYRVRPVRLEHPGGAVGYRVEADGAAVCVFTDTAPFSRPDAGLSAGRPPPLLEQQALAAAQGADLVIMDTMFTWEEYLERMHWGHGHPGYAHELARVAGARRVVFFHHSPEATDDDLDATARAWAERPGPEVLVAREGMVIDLSG